MLDNVCGPIVFPHNFGFVATRLTLLLSFDCRLNLVLGYLKVLKDLDGWEWITYREACIACLEVGTGLLHHGIPKGTVLKRVSLVENIEAWNSFPWDPKVIPRALGWSKKSLFTRSDYPFLFAKESRSTLDIRPTIAEYQSSWWIDNNLYFQEFVPRAPPIKEHHGLFEKYLSKLEKVRKHRKTGFMVSSIGGTTNNSVRKKWLNDLVIMELNFRLFELETIIQVLSHERSDRHAKLKFTNEFSSMTSDLCDSLNSMFVDLIEPADTDEDIGQENRIRLDESKRLRLEEENMLQLEQQKKNKRKEFMNLNHCKNLLSKLAPAKRIQLCSSSEKIQPKVSWVKIKKYRQQVYDPCTAEFLKTVKLWVEDTLRVLQSMDTVWLSDYIECFLGQ
nr:phospholipase-like protein [Tanacetum cinerariifolium]